MDIARKAYPDVPLFRYPYTDLGKAQIAAALGNANGPGSKSAFDTEGLAGRTVRFSGEGAPDLAWAFSSDGRVTLNGGRSVRYGALRLEQVTLVTHLVPGTTQAYALIWNRQTNAATVFELWFGGGPAPRAREIDRAVWHGAIGSAPAAGAEQHHGDAAQRRPRPCLDRRHRHAHDRVLLLGHVYALGRARPARRTPRLFGPGGLHPADRGTLRLRAGRGRIFRAAPPLRLRRQHPAIGRLPARLRRARRPRILHVPRERRMARAERAVREARRFQRRSAGNSRRQEGRAAHLQPAGDDGQDDPGRDRRGDRCGQCPCVRQAEPDGGQRHPAERGAGRQGLHHRLRRRADASNTA